MAPLLPSTRLFACPACHEHVRTDDPCCPHCGAELRGDGWVARAASAVLVGLVLSGCPDKDGGSTSNGVTGEPAYGVATSELTTTTTDGAEYGAPTTTELTTTTTSTTTTTTTSASTSTDGPEYGVPSTTDPDTTSGSSGSSGSSTIEPDYGVPQTTTT